MTIEEASQLIIDNFPLSSLSKELKEALQTCHIPTEDLEGINFTISERAFLDRFSSQIKVLVESIHKIEKARVAFGEGDEFEAAVGAIVKDLPDETKLGLDYWLRLYSQTNVTFTKEE